MEHQLISGDGGKYLPLARNLIRKLRALGLHAASNHVEVNGYKIHAEIFGQHDTIRITSGGWVAYPVAVDLRTSTIHVKPTVDVTPRTPTNPPEEPDWDDYRPELVDVPAIPYIGYTRDLESVNDLPPITNQPTGSFALPSPHSHIWGVKSTSIEGAAYNDTLSDAQAFSGLISWDSTYSEIDGWILREEPGDPVSYRYWEYYDTTTHSTGADGTDVDSINARYDALMVTYADGLAEHDAAVAENEARTAAAEAEFNGDHDAWEVAYAEWEASEEAANEAHNAAIAAAKAAARISSRPEQIARLYAEVNKGVNEPWVSVGTLPPPITPRVRHALPFPVAIDSFTTDPLTDDDTFTFAITDYSVDPPTVRTVEGTRKNAAMSGVPGSCGLSFGRSVVVSMLVGQSVIDAGVHPPFGRQYIPNPNMSFGYLATGYTQQLEGGVQTVATYTTPPEYLKYLKTEMEAADVDDVIESDAYVLPGAKLLLVHFEWETFDIFLSQWVWVPVPYALRIDPIYLCGGDQEFGAQALVRAVRLRKITKQTLGEDWIWTAPTDVELDPAPSFERTVTTTEDSGLTDCPPAVAILSKLPSITLPPKKDGDLAEASVYARRLSSDADLRDLRNTEWTGNHTAPEWVDRLVMEALYLTKTYGKETT